MFDDDVFMFTVNFSPMRHHYIAYGKHIKCMIGEGVPCEMTKLKEYRLNDILL